MIFMKVNSCNTKAALLILFTFAALALLSFPVMGQQHTTGDPSEDTFRFRTPEGRPDIYNIPDEEGRLLRPMKAERNPGQLMDSHEVYPPPHVRRVLLILTIIVGIAFYFLFLHKPIFSLAASAMGFIKGQSILEQLPEPEEKLHQIKNEKESIQKRIIEACLEAESKTESQIGIVNFSAQRALLLKNSKTDIEDFQINSIQIRKNIKVFFVESNLTSETLLQEIIFKKSSPETFLIYLSAGISWSNLMQGIILKETGKMWNQMDDAEKHNFYSENKAFKEKYGGVINPKNLFLNSYSFKNFLEQCRRERPISAVVIEDIFSLSASADITGGVDESQWDSSNMEPFAHYNSPYQTIRELITDLELYSAKEGFPVFIIDQVKRHEFWGSLRKAEAVR